METTEKIVEAYVRYVKGWLTITNLKCREQLEIDLLAVDLQRPRLRRYHIETGVSISGGFSRLTTRPYSADDLKIRVKAAGQRRTLGYFLERKFSDPAVIARLADFSFNEGNYSKIIVSWGWTDEALSQADHAGVTLWDFRDLLTEIAEHARAKRTYYTDDTMRTLQLMAKSIDEKGGAAVAAARLARVPHCDQA